MRTTLFFVVVTLLFSAVLAFSQDAKVDFSGTWLFDKDKSEMGEGGGGRGGRNMAATKMIVIQEKNKLVVGTQCRILYQDALGRRNIALKFNEMIRNGEIGPVMLGRDHHDTGGTDSPYRETSNIYDGSNVTADMAIAMRAATPWPVVPRSVSRI